MAPRCAHLPGAPTSYIGRTWLGRKSIEVEWSMFFWDCRNIFDWTESKRLALLATKEGASMTPSHLHQKSKVSNLEWLMNWPWEQITGLSQFPSPARLDTKVDVKMSAQILELRKTYFEVKAPCPSIQEPGFRWEQLDDWDIAVGLRERPEVGLIGGSKLRYSPGVSGLIAFLSTFSKDLLWIIPLAFILSLFLGTAVVVAFHSSENRPIETSWMKILLKTSLMLLFLRWCASTVAIHKGISGSLTLTKEWPFLACADCKKAIKREADQEKFTIC